MREDWVNEMSARGMGRGGSRGWYEYGSVVMCREMFVGVGCRARMGIDFWRWMDVEKRRHGFHGSLKRRRKIKKRARLKTASVIID